MQLNNYELIRFTKEESGLPYDLLFFSRHDWQVMPNFYIDVKPKPILCAVFDTGGIKANEGVSIPDKELIESFIEKNFHVIQCHWHNALSDKELLNNLQKYEEDA